MLTNCLAACAHLTITVSEIQRDISGKSSIFIRFGTTHERDRWMDRQTTDGHCVPAIAALCIASHGKNGIRYSYK